MDMMKYMTVLLVAEAAMMNDCCSGRISNRLLIVGAVNGMMLCFLENGLKGIGNGIFGALIPLIACICLFSLSMLGAGDVKLLMTLGIYLGVQGSFRLLWETLLLGACMAILQFASYPHLLQKRCLYLKNYAWEMCIGNGKPYIDERELDSKQPWLMHMAVPIFGAVGWEVVRYVAI